MKLRWCTYIILLLETAVVVAQGDSVQVTRNFRFQDGIYLSFEDLYTTALPRCGGRRSTRSW